MRFVVDVNLSKKWAAELRNAGHEAAYWTEFGRETDADDIVMLWARENGAVVLTCDLDFSAILAASGDTKPSVVQLRPGRHRPELLLGRLTTALHVYRETLETGVLLTIDLGNARVHRLPLVENDF